MHKQQRQGAADGQGSASTTGQAREESTAAAELHAAWNWAADGLWWTDAGRGILNPEQRAWLVSVALRLRTEHHGAVEAATDALVEVLRARQVSTEHARMEHDRRRLRRWLLACWRPHGEAYPCWCDGRLP